MSTVRSVIFDIIGRDNASRAFRSASAAANAAATQSERASYRMIAAGAKTQAYGQKITKHVTLPLLALGAASVYQAAKYEKSLNTIRVATGRSAAEMDVFRQGIKKLAVETGTSLDQLTEGAYIAAKTFRSPADALVVLAAASKGAKAEGVDLHTAVTALTSGMASYGLKAKDAVNFENQMIAASGLAKTTFADFAGSLSTVLPLAGALGISFAEVGGAIATMTQHGETAQQSTENLRNLITNLAGQNNVASSAMQQLGIRSVDLQHDLGKNGLYGTLQIVLGALRKHGKAGMVVYDTFKQSALASASFQDQLKGMNGAVRVQSEALLKGKTDIQGYYKFVKSFGDSKQGNLGLQFLQTFKKFKGYNDLLKSGRGNAQTYAKALQTMLGGVTGLGAALKLLGPDFVKNNKSTALWSGNIKKVGDAAKDSQGQVRGWAETQQLLSTKFDIAKQKFHVFLVDLGTKLMPIATSVVGWLSKIAGWLTKVGNGWGSTALKIALFAAAVGPVMAVFGRLLRFAGALRLAAVGMVAFGRGIAGVSSSAAMANTKLQTTATTGFRWGQKLRTGAQGMFTMAGGIRAIGSAMTGVIAAQATGGGTGGFIQSVLFGAAGGAMFGGGPGAIIGGLTAAIFKGVQMWQHHGDAAKAALQAEMQYVKELTSLIEADNGELGKNVRLNVNKKLFDAGTYKLGDKLNNDTLTHGIRDMINPGDILNAAMGKSDSGFQKFALSFGSKLRKSLHLGVAEFAKGYGNDFNKLIADFAKADPKFLNGKQKVLQQIAKDYTKLHDAISPLSQDAQNATAAWRVQFTSLNQGRKVYGGLSRGLQELRRNQLAAENTDGNMIHALRGTGLAAQHNQEVFHSLASAARSEAVQVAQAALKHGSMNSALRAGNASLAQNRRAILAAAVAAGFSKTAVAALLTSLLHLGRTEVKPKVKVDDGSARSTIEALQAWFNSLTWTAHVTASGSGVSAGPGQRIGVARANGGSVPDGWFTVGERGWELGRKVGNHVEIYSNSQSKKMTGMNRVPGYANGTGGITHKGNDWIYGGIKYSSQRQAENARTRAADKKKVTKQDWQGVVSGLAGAVFNPGSSKSEFVSATRALLKLAKAAGVASKTLTRMTHESKRLDQMAGRRDTLRNRLGTGPTASTAFDRLGSLRDARSSERDSIRSTFAGTFSAATAGVRESVYNDKPAPKMSAGTILSDLRNAANKARKFASTLVKLGKLHLPGFMLRQLAEAGPDALPQALALAQSSKAQLAAFRHEGRVLDQAGRRAGNYEAGRLYDTSITRAQKRVAKLQRQIRDLNKRIHNLGLTLENQARHAGGLHADRTHRIQGPPTHHKAPHHKAPHHHGGARHHNDGITINVYPSADMDETAIAVAVGRRVQAHLGAM